LAELKTSDARRRASATAPLTADGDVLLFKFNV